MKPARIIIEQPEVWAARKERERASDNILAELEHEQPTQWRTAKQMLSWFFAMRGRMETAPAIDPSREVIQGLQVDRDDRIHKLAYVGKLFEALIRQQGNTRGAALLMLHFQAPTPVGYVIHTDGRRVLAYGNPSVAIRDLSKHAGIEATRDQTIRDFWRAYTIVEELALERGFIAERTKRPVRSANVVRRSGP